MKRRKWDSPTKARIVLEGLRGRPVGDLCSAHQVSQTQYYQWRDQFLSHAHRVFETAEQTRTETRLQRENQRLKEVVGELTVELKKATRCGDESPTPRRQ